MASNKRLNCVYLLISIISLTIIHYPSSSVNACSCLSSEEPKYCTTNFFALLLITDEQIDNNTMTVDYTFQPISVIQDDQRLLKKYNTLHSYGSSATCGIQLKVGHKYLIGSNVDMENERLILHLCRSYVQQFSRSLSVLTKNFKSLLQQCNYFKRNDDNNPVISGLSINNQNHNHNVNGKSNDHTNNNSQIEREGESIMNYPHLGITEDELRRKRKQQQQAMKQHQ